MEYSIVIPTYNKCEEYLKPCIDSIIKYTDMANVELIVVANGCKDNTKEYLTYLYSAIPSLTIDWYDDPIGFSKAVNVGVKLSLTNKIVILNNDTVLLDQPKNNWLERLDTSDISGVLFNYSAITKKSFAVFFCVMIKKKVFRSIGFLDEDFEVGGSEDIDFCKRAQDAGYQLKDVGFAGDFPIYHVAEGTVHDKTLVTDWNQKFKLNEIKLAKKYNIDQYKYLLSNNYERAIFLKDDIVFPREAARYEWAAQNILGSLITEIGCSTGYGSQYFSEDVYYLGLDYDPIIIDVARKQYWGITRHFDCADINTYKFEESSTIIAFEVIEHLDNGLEVVDMLKKHCKRLLITVPYLEPKGLWGEHHKLHGLSEKDFSGFMFNYIDEHGNITKTPRQVDESNKFNLMICRWDDV